MMDEYDPFEPLSNETSDDECFSDDDVNPVVFESLRRRGKAEQFANAARRRGVRFNSRASSPKIVAVKVITDRAYLTLNHEKLAYSPILYVPRSAVKPQGADPVFRENTIFLKYPKTIDAKAAVPAKILKRVRAYEHKFDKAQARFILSLLFRTYTPVQITHDVFKRHENLPRDLAEEGANFEDLMLELDPRSEDKEIEHGRLSQSGQGVVATATSLLAQKYWTKGTPSTKCSQRAQLWYSLQQVFKPAVAFRIIARFGYFK